MKCSNCPFLEFHPDGNDYCTLHGGCITTGQVESELAWNSDDDAGCSMTKREIRHIYTLQKRIQNIYDDIDATIEEEKERKHREDDKRSTADTDEPRRNTGREVEPRTGRTQDTERAI